MALEGETLCGKGGTYELSCDDCGELIPFKVCRSNAGFYVGTWCKCGPYSRESAYYGTVEGAEQALNSGNFTRNN